MEEKKIGAIEVVTFKVKSGYSQEEAKESMEKLNGLIKNFDGFIGRKLSVDENGVWMDLVYWESKALAMEAAEKVMQIPEAGEAFSVIDESSMQMYHFDPMMSFSK